MNYSLEVTIGNRPTDVGIQTCYVTALNFVFCSQSLRAKPFAGFYSEHRRVLIIPVHSVGCQADERLLRSSEEKAQV